MSFGIKLKELRIEKGLTQKELAKEFNVNRVSITDWETREIEPSYDTLCKIAKFFDVTTDYLLGLED